MAAAPRTGKPSSRWGAAIAMVVLAFAGCGKSALNTAPAALKAARGDGVPAASAAVIEVWADALRTGHLQRAAAYWAHPSVMVNGTDAVGHLALIHIDSQRDALLADQTLPCGATLRSTMRSGAYVQALFRLSVRAGQGASASGCSGPASVDFVVRDGLIVRWLRVAVPPNGPGGEQQPPGIEAPGAQSS